MDFESAVKYLKSFTSYEDVPIENYSEIFELERIVDFLREFGVEYERLKYVHVAGSKGKGTVCSMVAQYLSRNGYVTGLFTSPHLVDQTECFWLDGENISQEEFVMRVENLKKFIDGVGGTKLTYFELLTVLVLQYFVDMKVDFAVLEVGLGGRLDPTNVVQPLVTGLTMVEKEHTAVLGDTYEEILNEKLGIMKPVVSMIFGPQNEEVRAILEQRFGKIECAGSNEEMAMNILKELPVRFSGDSFAEMMSEFWVPGRFDVREIEGKTVVFDIAHTGASMRNLVRNLEKGFSGCDFVFWLSLMGDKDAGAILGEVRGVATRVYFTKSHPIRGMEAKDLQKIYGSGKIEDDFQKILKSLQEKEILVVTGSHFLVGKIFKELFA